MSKEKSKKGSSFMSILSRLRRSSDEEVAAQKTSIIPEDKKEEELNPERMTILSAPKIDLPHYKPAPKDEFDIDDVDPANNVIELVNNYKFINFVLANSAINEAYEKGILERIISGEFRTTEGSEKPVIECGGKPYEIDEIPAGNSHTYAFKNLETNEEIVLQISKPENMDQQEIERVARALGKLSPEASGSRAESIGHDRRIVVDGQRLYCKFTKKFPRKDVSAELLKSKDAIHVRIEKSLIYTRQLLEMFEANERSGVYNTDIKLRNFMLDSDGRLKTPDDKGYISAEDLLGKTDVKLYVSPSYLPKPEALVYADVSNGEFDANYARALALYQIGLAMLDTVRSGYSFDKENLEYIRLIPQGSDDLIGLARRNVYLCRIMQSGQYQENIRFILDNPDIIDFYLDKNTKKTNGKYEEFIENQAKFMKAMKDKGYLKLIKNNPKDARLLNENPGLGLFIQTDYETSKLISENPELGKYITKLCDFEANRKTKELSVEAATRDLSKLRPPQSKAGASHTEVTSPNM